MNVRTPLGLFVGIVVAGSPLAVGVGMAYAASHNDGFIPTPAKSPGAVQDFGNAPKTYPTPPVKTKAPVTEWRVESETYNPEVVKQAPETTQNSTRAREATSEPTTPASEPEPTQETSSPGPTAPPQGGGPGGGVVSVPKGPGNEVPQPQATSS